MQVTVEHPTPHTAVVRPQGRVDAESSPRLREVLRELPSQKNTQIVVDLRRVSFMDSSGLSALVSGLKATRQKEGALVLVGPNEQVRMALKLTMLDRVFRIYETIEEALSSLTGER